MLIQRVRADRAPRARHAAFDDTPRIRGEIQVLLIQLLADQVRRVFHAPPRRDPGSEPMHQVRLHFVAGARGDGANAAVARVLGAALVEPVVANLAGWTGLGDIAILTGGALSRLGEPVVKQRGVLAAADRPEKGVAERGAPPR